MRVEKGLKDLNPTNLSFPEDTIINKNDNLCPQYEDYQTNVRNFGKKKERKFVHTSLFMVQSESNLLKMFHIETSQMSTI